MIYLNDIQPSPTRTVNPGGLKSSSWGSVSVQIRFWLKSKKERKIRENVRIGPTDLLLIRDQCTTHATAPLNTLFHDKIPKGQKTKKSNVTTNSTRFYQKSDQRIQPLLLLPSSRSNSSRSPIFSAYSVRSRLQGTRREHAKKEEEWMLKERNPSRQTDSNPKHCRL